MLDLNNANVDLIGEIIKANLNYQEKRFSNMSFMCELGLADVLC